MSRHYRSILNVLSEPFDPDAIAFLAASGITDPTISSAINTLVIDLKSYNLWNKGTVILPYVGGNATAHCINLKTATNGIAFSGGVIHNSNGVTFNGLNGYGVVEYTVNTSNQYSRSVVQYIRNYTTGNGTWAGAFDGTHVFGFAPAYQGGFYIVADGLNRLHGFIPSPLISFGCLAAIVTASNSAKIYNTTNITGTISNPNSTPNNNLKMYSGALNSSGSPSFYSGESLGFEFYGEGLSDSEYFNLNSIIVLFNTTLSRNV